MDGTSTVGAVPDLPGGSVTRMMDGSDRHRILELDCRDQGPHLPATRSASQYNYNREPVLTMFGPHPCDSDYIRSQDEWLGELEGRSESEPGTETLAQAKGRSVDGEGTS